MVAVKVKLLRPLECGDSVTIDIERGTPMYEVKLKLQAATGETPATHHTRNHIHTHAWTSPQHTHTRAPLAHISKQPQNAYLPT